MKKQIWGSKFPKKGPQKKKKWENAQKQPILGMFWCIRATKSGSPEFRRSCKVVFCSSFTDQDGWDAEKSWNSVKSGFLCQKCWFFTKSQSFFGGTCARIIKLDMNWIETALEYCTFTLISSLERKRSNIQCKLWNCPPHPLFLSTVWRLQVSDYVFYCHRLSVDVKRVSNKFHKGYLSAVLRFERV